MKNFNKFSFHQFLESRDESFYREAEFDVDNHRQAGKEVMNKLLEQAIKAIKVIVGSKENDPHKNIQNLDFGLGEFGIPTSNNTSSWLERNIVGPLKLLTDKILSKWTDTTTKDGEKVEYLKKIIEICDNITPDNSRFMTQTTHSMNDAGNQLRASSHGHSGGHDAYLDALNERIMQPLKNIKTVIEKDLVQKPVELVAPPAAPVEIKKPGFLSRFLGGK
jgi:hypothetical protein